MQCGLLSLALLTLGCGGDTGGRIDIEGTATFNGLPIPFGDVMLLPDQEQGHKGPAGTATITDGKYSTALDGQGVVPGPHILRITAYPMMPIASENELEETLAVDPLFIDYTMTADISGPNFDIVVPADAEGFNTSGAGSETSGGNAP
jgi:hypothetical protein